MQVTRGMRRRSEKMARRRDRLPADALIAGVDLAKKESVVVFVRASDRARVGRLRVSSDRAGTERLVARGRELVAEQGSGPLVIAMEPTSHFWKPVARAADGAGVGYVLVQGFVVARARELDDLTRDKTDARDAALIADLAAELRFTETRLPEGAWAELDLLVAARDARRIERAASLQEVRALLELAWPGLLSACPALAGTHLQALLRTGITPQAMAALSPRRFTALLRRHHPRRRPTVRHSRPATKQVPGPRPRAVVRSRSRVSSLPPSSYIRLWHVVCADCPADATFGRPAAAIARRPPRAGRRTRRRSPGDR